MKTPYEILNVAANITDVDLRIAYRTKIHEYLQRKISPGDFRCICRAYETLSDNDKRKKYDSHKEWISELPIDNYTPQQLAAEPDIINVLTKKLEKANLRQINAQDPITGHTILYCAARAGNLKGVVFLTNHGAEPDLQQRTMSTALHVASFYSHADVVQYLLESGADYRILNRYQSTAEKEASNANVKQVFAEMKQNDYVRVAANEFDWFKKNGLKKHVDTEHFSQRQTLLHCASKKGHFDLVKWLVEKCSANINLVDSNDNTALHLAAYGGHVKIVEYLLNLGCDSTLRSRWGTTAEEEGKHHGTKMTDLFKLMCERDMFEMARKGVDWWFYYYFNEKTTDAIDSNGISLLYYASRDGHYSVVKWLLEHKANVNIQMRGPPRSTSLHAAKYYGHVSIVELLLNAGADINIQNDHKNTVFTETVRQGVSSNAVNQINKLLQQHQHSLKGEKILDVHVYEDEGDDKEPKVKLKFGIEAKYKDLLDALLQESGKRYQYFSIARRMLDFKYKPDATILSAVCRARYGFSRFINTPICLTCHEQLPANYQHQNNIHEDPKLDYTYFNELFSATNKNTMVTKKKISNKIKSFNIDQLSFTFSDNSVTTDRGVGVPVPLGSVPKERERNGPFIFIDFFNTLEYSHALFLYLCRKLLRAPGSWERKPAAGSGFIGTRNPYCRCGFTFPETRNPLWVRVPKNPESAVGSRS